MVLADISGYTSYLASTELDHANEILSDLLETITDQLVPPLTLAKLEGDAVFSYAPGHTLPRGETPLDTFDQTYLAFRDRVAGMQRQTTCTCNACRAIPTLDPKFITHYGNYLIQQVGHGQELVGSDVNLVHRLLKNHVDEATGWTAYVLFIETARKQVGLEQQHLCEYVETYDHLGEVKTYSFDLQPRYAALSENRKVVVSVDEADQVCTRDLHAPIPVVWDWLNDPKRFAQWMGSKEIRHLVRPGGRTGVGARNHCAHGKYSVQQTIVDWKPFEYFTVESKVPGSVVLMTYALTPTETGTRLRVTGKFTSRVPGLLRGPLFRATSRTEAKADVLTRLVEAEARQRQHVRQQEEPVVVAEPSETTGSI